MQNRLPILAGVLVAAAVAASPVIREPVSPSVTSNEWPGEDKASSAERYSPLNQINTMNVGRLKVLCTYDTRQYTSFEAGPIMVHNALIGTTEQDIFSIDAGTCRENWRTHEDYKPASPLAMSRGAAYMDGLLFRGTEDGRVLAYDFKTGKRMWATIIGDQKLGDRSPAVPIARNGFVFIGNAGSGNKGAQGRTYALDPRTGEIIWEFYLVPKPRTGAAITGGTAWTHYVLDPVTGEIFAPGNVPGPDFAVGLHEGGNLPSGTHQSHSKPMPQNWHDWDTSGTPTVIQTRSGRKLLAVAPKDGHLYGFDLGTNTLLYRVPVTRKENIDAPFAVGKPANSCPGTTGGSEWNGPAYDPRSNLILIGEVEGCSAADPSRSGAGWIYAVDADSGVWKWRLKSHYPIFTGMTPTGGGLVFFGDASGSFYALDASNGARLWGQKVGGAIGGGVITYTTDGQQKVAVTAGFTSNLRPTAVVTGKIVILGL